MKLSIKQIRSGNVSSHHSRQKSKLLLKLNRASDKNQRAEQKAKKEAVQADQRAERIDNYPPGTLLNKVGTRAGMTGLNQDPVHIKRRRAMRTIYNKKMPVPACNGCQFANACPQFKAGYVCAFLPMLNSHKIESIDDVRHYMRDFAAAGARRYQFALTGETIMGSKPSLETTEMGALVFQQMRDVLKMEQEAETSEVIVEGDDSIIGQLFGNMNALLDDTKTSEKDSRPQRDPKKKKKGVFVKKQKKGKSAKFKSPDEIELPDFGGLKPGVDSELLHAYSQDQLLARTRRKREVMPGTAHVTVSTAR